MSEISWIKLSVAAKGNPTESDKIILSEISGCFMKNSFNALMGPSGSGKSTLLKCLNGSNKYCLSEDSKIFVKNDKNIRRVFIYQDQEDRIMTDLTVEQSLTYSSKINNSCEPGVNHQKIVSDILTELLLNDVSSNRIENCSGGQIKRVCIGLELTSIKAPNLLFIDEPTTGLDSNAAEVVIDCLKKLTINSEMTTIVSIHQPNNDLFEAFDKIYVLAKGGVCVYSGSPLDLRQHLNECNIICDQNQVPIEVLIKIGSADNQNIKLKQLYGKTKTDIQNSMSDLNDLTLIENNQYINSKRFSLIDFLLLLMRFFRRNYVSNFTTAIKQFLLYVLMIIFSLQIFNDNIFQSDACFQLNTTSNFSCIELIEQESNISNNIIFTWFVFGSSLLLQSILSVISYANDMKIFTVEHKSSWYSPGSFFWSKFIIEISTIIVYSILFILTMQTFTHQFSDERRLVNFSYMVLLAFLCNHFISSTIGMVLSKNINLAVFVALMTFVTLMFFNNCVLKIEKSNIFFVWISETNFLNYTFNSILIIIYGFGRCSPGYESRVLIEFDLIENDSIYYMYSKRLLIYSSILVVIEFMAFWVKSINFSIKSKKFKVKNTETLCHIINYSDEDFIQINCFPQVIDKNSEQLMISWKDLTFSVNNLFIKGEGSNILNSISGSFQANTLNAIMGPSGSGKTTLLKCLNLRNINGLSEESKIYLNSSRRLKSCFIVQNISEHLLNGLTVRQTLLYASKLKNSQIMMNLDHNKNVEKMMSKLLISDISENRIEICSGGEQKRIVIASELTSFIKPNLFCIDEPTSGLDSRAAEKMISVLHQITVKYNITTIVSIHQPNNDLLQMFDKIYVLANGGVCVYSGHPNSLSRHLIDSDICLNRNQVPIEVLLKISSKDKNDFSLEKLLYNHKLSSTNFINDKNLKEIIDYKYPTKRFSKTDFYYLLMRTMKHRYHYQWKELLMQFFTYISIAVILRFIVSPEVTKPDGCYELQLTIGCAQTLEGLKNQTLIKQNIRYHFFFTSVLSMVVVVIISVTFCNYFKILRNEVKNGWYSIGAYFWSKFMVDLIPDLITMICFCYIVSLYNSWTINLVYYYAVIMVISCTQSVAQISAILFSNNPKLSMAIATVVVIFLNMLGNTLVPVKKLHPWLQFISDFTYIKLIFDLIIIVIYGLDRCPKNSISLVLHELGIESEMFYTNIINLIIICLALKVLTLLLLTLKIDNRVKSNRKYTENSKLDDQVESNLVIF